MVPFESLGAVSYLYSIATMDIIFRCFDTLSERDIHQPASHTLYDGIGHACA